MTYTHVPSFDGTEIEAWVGLPDLAAGVLAPAILIHSPYIGIVWQGAQAGSPSDPDFWTDPPGPTGLPPDPIDASAHSHLPVGEFISAGYAVVLTSVRGMGGSGGCSPLRDVTEGKDAAHLVEWVADQPWSNGRVGMVGTSWPGTTALWAAALQPESLKAVLVGVPVINEWLWIATPQGGQYTYAPTKLWSSKTSTGFFPSLARATETGAYPAQKMPERVCDDAEQWRAQEAQWTVTGDRPDEAWATRDLWRRLGTMSAAVFLTQGFRDTASGLWAEDEVWQQTAAPLRTVFGPWGHCAPQPESDCVALSDTWGITDWRTYHFAWFDYWLKGLGAKADGAPPAALRLGVADYQVDDGTWRESARWPPAEEREEVLYLVAGALNARPGAVDTTYVASPHGQGFHDSNIDGFGVLEFEDGGNGWWADLCAPGDAETPHHLAFLSEPLVEPAVIAGNAFALLNVTSNQEGGLIGMQLLRVPSAFTCDDPASEDVISILTAGAADLRFHAGNIDALPFATGTPTPVRIDAWNGAFALAAGDRIGVVLGQGPLSSGMGAASWAATRYAPEVTVHAGERAEASHIVVPLVAGTFGGASPTAPDPPKPFVYP